MANTTRKPRIFAYIACATLLAAYLAPRATIDNFPLVEAYAALALLVFSGASLVGIVWTLFAWRRTDWLTRVLPFVSPVVALADLSLTRFGTPVVDIQTTYIGAHDQILVDITYGFGISGNQVVRRNEVWTTNMGPPTKRLGVGWKTDFHSPMTEQSFDLSDDIPTYGSDRIIHVTISDTEISYDVTLK